MGQVLHGCATTTEAVRRAIQDSQASLRALARRYGVNPKTIAKWRKAVPYDIRIVLTDNGIQFADLPKNRNGPTARFRGHPFDRACQRHDIEHRLTKPNHPWTNGQVERMNRSIKGAIAKRFHYDSHDQLRRHLDDFVSAYNFACRLKTLKGLTPSPRICSR